MRREKGFTILEVLIVVAILGILAAIAIWNYFTAIQRGKQRRTMADIRTIAVAWEARAVDSRAYNAAGFTLPAVALPTSDLNTMLVPTYVKAFPALDGWGNRYEFYSNAAVGTTTQASEYALRSPGRDGVFSGNTYPGGGTTSFDCDIVYSAGSFIQYPEATQN